MGRQLTLGLRLSDQARLDQFVRAEHYNLTADAPLTYISGLAGSGKSHLLQALCHESLSRQNTAIYLCGLGSLEPEILDGLETYQLVCLDNIDEVMTESSWQESLFHLVNATRDAGGRLIVSAAVSASHLDVSLADLASRLKGSQLINLVELDDDGKLEVIRRKAGRRGFEMPDEVCRFILARSHRDMHHLSRLVDQLDEETLRLQKKVTIPFVKDALGL